MMGDNLLQLNAGKRQAVWDELAATLHLGDGLKIILLQEPMFHGKSIRNLPNGKIIYKPGIDSPRSGIYLENNFEKLSDATLLTNLSDRDQTAVQLYLQLPGGCKIDAVICSVYLPGPKEINDNVVTDKFRSLVSFCKNNKKEMIVGCDVNAHHFSWGCDKCDSRGDRMAEFLAKENLIILNQGNTPTFYPENFSSNSIIDITIVTSRIERRISNWFVDTNYSGSDHRKISFSLALAGNKNLKYRQKKSTDWIGYRKTLISKLNNLDFSCDSTTQLEYKSNLLSKIILEAYKENCRLKKKKEKNKQTWFSQYLMSQRKNLRKIERQAATKTELRDLFKAKKREYVADCRKAKLESYKKMLVEMENTKDISRLQKLFESQNLRTMGTLLKEDSTYTSNREETHEVLFNHHFNGCEVYRSNEEFAEDSYEPWEANDEEKIQIKKCITVDKIKWALSSFKPFKSPGEDEIFPALLQRASDIISDHLQKLFESSLNFSFVPKSWRGTLVTYIPKAGKDTYSTADAYRPICLISFLFKTLEKLVDKKIRFIDLEHNKLDSSQHAYQEGKGTESAIHSLLSYIEKALDSDKINLTVFIDISGAFDKTPIDVIEKHARLMGIENWTIKWMVTALKNRRVKSQNENSNIVIKPVKGIPQGGCLSPLMWCLVVHFLLPRLKSIGMKVTCYADDVAISLVGNDCFTLCEKMNEAMKILKTWCLETGLHVNPKKTQMMRFTRRTKKGMEMKPLKLFGEVLTLEKDYIKYLGVYLDPKLSMKSHIEEVYKKAVKSLWATRRMVQQSWGLTPTRMKYLYNQIILPRITYGSIAFWHKAKNKTNSKTLEKIQRTAMLMITGATRTTPTAALYLITNLYPVHIIIEATAIACYHRLKLAGTWLSNTSKIRHGAIISEHDKLGLIDNIDRTDKLWFTDQKHETCINDARNWNYQMSSIQNPIKMWSDGSGKNNKTGAGVYCEEMQLQKSVRLSDHATIMQAEVFGINACIEECTNRAIMGRNIVISSDSQAAIKSLSRGYVDTRSVQKCLIDIQSLQRMANKIFIYWVPSHVGIEGNEKADQLANEATEKDLIDLEVPYPKSTWENNLDDWKLKKSNYEWTQHTSASFAKTSLPKYDKAKSDEILKRKRSDVRIITDMITGHFALKKYLHKLGKSETDKCRFCNEHPENVQHLLQQCPNNRITLSRNKHFGSFEITNEDLKDLRSSDLLMFAKDTGIFILN